MSPDFLPPATCDFSNAIQGKGYFQGKTLEKGHFPFIAWEKSHVAGDRKSGLTNQCASGSQGRCLAILVRDAGIPMIPMKTREHVRGPLCDTTMRAEIFAYIINMEGPENPEYVMHIFYLKYSGPPKYENMLGNSLPIGPVQQTTENY